MSNEEKDKQLLRAKKLISGILDLSLDDCSRYLKGILDKSDEEYEAIEWLFEVGFYKRCKFKNHDEICGDLAMNSDFCHKHKSIVGFMIGSN